MGKEKKVFSEAAAWSLPVSSPCADWQGDIGPLAKGWSKILLSAPKQVGFPCEPCTRWSLQIESYRSLTKKKKEISPSPTELCYDKEDCNHFSPLYLFLWVKLMSAGRSSLSSSNQAVFWGWWWWIPLSPGIMKMSFLVSTPNTINHTWKLSTQHSAVSCCKLQPCLRPIIKIRT